MAGIDSVILGGGCFWCLDAIYREMKGVVFVESGYAGGKIASPTYREVTSGLTGHAEVVKIHYDTTVIELRSILELFFKVHDPTTLNRQGADIGTQYRSVIIYYNDLQKGVAEELINELKELRVWKDPIVTSVEAYRNYFPAEDYHQDYFNKNPNAGYCQFVIVPKLNKARSIIKEKGL